MKAHLLDVAGLVSYRSGDANVLVDVVDIAAAFELDERFFGVSFVIAHIASDCCFGLLFREFFAGSIAASVNKVSVFSANGGNHRSSSMLGASADRI
jgi:hypothetical protein